MAEFELAVKLVDGRGVTERILPLPYLHWPTCIWYESRIYLHMVGGRYVHVDCVAIYDVIETVAVLASPGN